MNKELLEELKVMTLELDKLILELMTLDPIKGYHGCPGRSGIAITIPFFREDIAVNSIIGYLHRNIIFTRQFIDHMKKCHIFPCDKKEGDKA